MELRKSWWLLFFALACCLMYFGAVKSQNLKILSYQKKLAQLQRENAAIGSENKNLQLRINSQSDPAWIELILMKELGVVPEGKLKVHFTRQK